MTQTTRPELTPVLYPNGGQRYANAGATNQGKGRAMKECQACGGYVVFVESSRTGKWYLADCFPYANGHSYFYVKAAPHYKTCEKRAEVSASLVAEEHQRQIDRRIGLRLLEWIAEMKEAGTEITAEMMDAKSDEIRAEVGAQA
jgi:ssDNA-binding Zn-finger/Zn-ribbon topoisomerase 1